MLTSSQARKLAIESLEATELKDLKDFFEWVKDRSKEGHFEGEYGSPVEKTFSDRQLRYLWQIGYLIKNYDPIAEITYSMTGGKEPKLLDKYIIKW